MKQKILRWVYRWSSEINVWTWHQLNKFNRHRKYHPNKKYMKMARKENDEG